MIERVDHAHGARTDESELVERARGGDVTAFEELVRGYQRLATRAAYVITRDRADAEEAAQDGFVAAFRALGSFRRGAPFRPWLLRIVVNEAKDRRRSAARHRAIAERAVALDLPEKTGATSDHAVLDAERRNLLLAALDRLSSKHRDVVTCRYLLELSEEETASMLALRPGTVKSRLSRALAALEAQLEGVLS